MEVIKISNSKTKEASNLENTEKIVTPIKKLPIRQPVVFNISEEARKIIEEFKEYLIVNKKVSTTIKSYIFDVNRFIEFIESTGITFTGEFNVLQYNDFLKMQIENKFKANTINKRINSVQQFNIFLLVKKYMAGVIIISKNDKLPIEK